MPSTSFGGFSSVLCPVDFSEPSRLALQYAGSIARRTNAGLTVTYVNDPLLVRASAVALRDPDLARRSATELQRFVEAALCGQSRLQRPVKYRVAVGDPAREILAAVRRTRADLIVMGTHGLTGAERVLLGSTTLGVLRRTSVPVLAVPGLTSTARAGVPASWPGERILAPIELGPRAAREVETAARLAASFNTSLLLMHVVDRAAAPEWLTAKLDAHERIRIARAQAELDRLAGIARRRVPADTRVVSGRPADEIAALAASEQTGLLVTALRDRSGWLGLLRSSVSYHVLSHAVAPVLAYPATWRAR